MYLTPVSKLNNASGSNFSFKEWAPKAPITTVSKPNKAARPEIFRIISRVIINAKVSLKSRIKYSSIILFSTFEKIFIYKNIRFLSTFFASILSTFDQIYTSI